MTNALTGNNRLIAPFRLLAPEDDDPKQYVMPFFFSMVLHVVIFAGLIIGPGFGTDKDLSQSVISVSMVSLGDIRPDSGKGATQPVDGQTVRSKPPPAKPADEISIAPKPQKDTIQAPVKKKPKKSLKEKTFKPDKAMESAIKNIEEQVDEARPGSVSSAIEELRKKVKKNPSGPGTGTSGNPVTEGPAVIGGGGSGQVRALRQIDIYNAEIASRIQQNWAFSEQLAGDHKGLHTVIVMEILRNGNIQDIRLERKSGNRYLDESAYRAVRKADPLPPLPESYRGRIYTVGFRFTPTGIN